MTGTEIRTLRESLGLSPQQLANLLGVHLGTVYRWEAFEGTTLRLEPLQFSLLLQLQRQAAQRAPADLGKQLIEGLLIGGTLVGLAYLLSDLVVDKSQRRSK